MLALPGILASGRTCAVPDSLPVPPPRPANLSKSFARTIWIFWAQGWQNCGRKGAKDCWLTAAPPIAHACASSWEALHPSWTVRRISLHNLSDYGIGTAPTATRDGLPADLLAYSHRPHNFSPHYSDLVRTELLFMYGGLWVDATIFATEPIDSWLSSSSSGGDKVAAASRPSFYAVRYAGANASTDAVSDLPLWNARTIRPLLPLTSAGVRSAASHLSLACDHSAATAHIPFK